MQWKFQNQLVKNKKPEVKKTKPANQEPSQPTEKRYRNRNREQ